MQLQFRVYNKKRLYFQQQSSIGCTINLYIYPMKLVSKNYITLHYFVPAKLIIKSIIQHYNNSINIVITIAYNAMGISVSNSEANNQVEMVRQYKRQKRLEMIGSEVQKATYDKYDAAALKQNMRHSKSANVSPNRNNTRNSIQKEQNANKIFGSGQKKVQNNGPRVPEYLTKPQANELANSGQRKKTHERKFAETQQITNQRVTNPPDKAGRNSNKMAESKQRDNFNKNQKIDNKERKQAKLKSPATDNKSWEGPPPKQSLPAVRPSQHEEFNIQMRKLSFGLYDWNIPGQQQEDSHRKKSLIPSMNLVLSNKFAQHTSNISEQAEKLVAKSRRQVMREILSGKRNTADEDFKFLPNCNFQQLQISRVCKNR